MPMPMLTTCKSTATLTQHSSLYWWPRWRTALHGLKRGWRVMVFVSTSQKQLKWLGSSRRRSQRTKDAMIVSGVVYSSPRPWYHCWWRSVTCCSHRYVTSLCFFSLRQLRLIRRSKWTLRTSWSGRSYTADSTTVTPCLLASLQVGWCGCSLFWKRLLVLCLGYLAW